MEPYCELQDFVLKQLWNLEDWINDSEKVECGSGGYSCLSLDAILVLRYEYSFEEQCLQLVLLSNLLQHPYSSRHPENSQ